MALLDNLISYWNLDGDANDSVGNNDGTVTTPDFYTTNAKIVQSHWFNATTSKISVAHDASISFERTSAFSLSFWIRRNSNGINRSFITKQAGASAYTGFAFYQLSNNKLEFNFPSNAAANNILGLNTNNAFTSTDWMHIALTYSGSSNVAGIKVYVNGTEEATTAYIDSLTGSTLNTQPLLIGDKFDGGMDEVGIWGRVLSSTEITQLYNAGSGKAYPFSTAWTTTLTETTTITATLIKACSKILSQVLSLTDSIIKVTNYVLTQTITLTDTFFKQATRIFTETVVISDVVTGLKAIVKELTEIVTILDLAIGRIITIVLSEITTVTDTLIKISNRIFSEIINITDSIEKVVIYTKELIENISITDYIVRITERVFEEISTITDTITTSKMYTRIYTEITTITAIFEKQFNINRVFNETVNIVSEIIISINGVVTNMWSKVARTLDSWNKTPRN